MFLLVLFVHIFFPCDMLVFSLSEKLCAQPFTEFLNAVCLWVHRFENYLWLKREGWRFENDLSWFLTEKGRNEVWQAIGKWNHLKRCTGESLKLSRIALWKMIKLASLQETPVRNYHRPTDLITRVENMDTTKYTPGIYWLSTWVRSMWVRRTKCPEWPKTSIYIWSTPQMQPLHQCLLSEGESEVFNGNATQGKTWHTILWGQIQIQSKSFNATQAPEIAPEIKLH